jgi:hypothetical protein
VNDLVVEDFGGKFRCTEEGAVIAGLRIIEDRATYTIPTSKMIADNPASLKTCSSRVRRSLAWGNSLDWTTKLKRSSAWNDPL